MTIRNSKFLAFFLALTTWLALPVFAAEYVTLDRNAEPLRTNFDSEIGKVRIMLVIDPH